MRVLFFFNDTATTEIYTYCHTRSLHDALPISTNAVSVRAFEQAFAHADDSRAMPVPYLVKEGLDYPGMPTRYGTRALADARPVTGPGFPYVEDRKSTRLNSSP